MNAHHLLDVLEEESKKILREVGVLPLFEMPSLPQNISLLYVIVRAFNRDKQVFLIGNNYLKLTVNEVALILGLPNRGIDFTFVRLPCIDLTHKDLIEQINHLSVEDWSPTLESRRMDSLIRYLVNVFFFPLKRMKIPASLHKKNGLSTFVKYNWPKAIHHFLLSQVDALSQASVVKKIGVNLGYLEGCATILLVRNVNCNAYSLYYSF
ncbi:hypothetical protein KSP40_PGU021943 [Platanthera guangdongensis]|uniref:Uncharacterized protein n=1 Tax=Platanthera guangdongensis TaxID=2320717 RepID=A0ABR2M0Z0_9ASPA